MTTLNNIKKTFFSKATHQTVHTQCVFVLMQALGTVRPVHGQADLSAFAH